MLHRLWPIDHGAYPWWPNMSFFGQNWHLGVTGISYNFNETDLRRLACLYPSLEFLKSLQSPGPEWNRSLHNSKSLGQWKVLNRFTSFAKLLSNTTQNSVNTVLPHLIYMWHTVEIHHEMFLFSTLFEFIEKSVQTKSQKGPLLKNWITQCVHGSVSVPDWDSQSVDSNPNQGALSLKNSFHQHFNQYPVCVKSQILPKKSVFKKNSQIVNFWKFSLAWNWF